MLVLSCKWCEAPPRLCEVFKLVSIIFASKQFKVDLNSEDLAYLAQIELPGMLGQRLEQRLELYLLNLFRFKIFEFLSCGV